MSPEIKINKLILKETRNIIVDKMIAKEKKNKDKNKKQRAQNRFNNCRIGLTNKKLCTHYI